MTGWKFDAQKLACDLWATGLVHVVGVQDEIIFIQQIHTGERILSVAEFLSLCQTAGKEPGDYIR